VTLLINGAGQELQPIKSHVLTHFRSSVKVPGFRPGKAPVAMVEKHADQRLLADEFLEHAINDLFQRAQSDNPMSALKNSYHMQNSSLKPLLIL
jgi:FKBP-type peptidyl-prolyl cis-trans isomerase (trigger factor)